MNAKQTVRNNIARLLLVAGITRPASRSKRRLSIATFHRVLPEAQRQAYPYPELVVTPEELGKRRLSPFVVSIFLSTLRYTALRAALRANGKCIEPQLGLVQGFPNNYRFQKKWNKVVPNNYCSRFWREYCFAEAPIFCESTKWT